MEVPLLQMELNFAPKSFQTSVQLLVPYTLSSSQKPVSFIPSSLFTTHSKSNPHLVYRNRLMNLGFGACVSRGTSLKRACSGNFNEFLDDESAEQAEELSQKLDIADDDLDHDQDTTYALTEVSCDSSHKQHEDEDDVYKMFSMQFIPSKYELLEHNLLGIQPEPVDWPEREDIVRVNIEQKANCIGIPLSLRMLKRKQKWQEGFGDAGDFAYCSVKKAFSSLVFIIRELQSYALHIREGLYSEDLKEIISKMQREMNSSFVWLFQQVFSRTPTLMVYVMILLANFTVHSMSSSNVVVGATPLSLLSETLTETLSLTEEKNEEQSEINSSRIKKLLFSTSDVSNDGDGTIMRGSSLYGELSRSSSPSIQFPSFIPNDTSDVSSVKNYQMTKEEVDLWNSIVEEASWMKEESGYRILDHLTTKHFVIPVTVKLQPDDYVDYFRTDLLYQMGVAEEPNNSLLLSNYAQFLHLVARDYERYFLVILFSFFLCF